MKFTTIEKQQRYSCIAFGSAIASGTNEADHPK
jgi:hypothetical protein